MHCKAFAISDSDSVRSSNHHLLQGLSSNQSHLRTTLLQLDSCHSSLSVDGDDAHSSSVLISPYSYQFCGWDYDHACACVYAVLILTDPQGTGIGSSGH
jgi:hypothetical protein